MLGDYKRKRSWPHLRYYPTGNEENRENISVDIVGNQVGSWELPNTKQ
jgi:hypothetical protein